LGKGRGEEGKKEVKKASFPTLSTMIVSSELPVSMTEKHIFLKSYFTSFGIGDMTSQQGMRYTST